MSRCVRTVHKTSIACVVRTEPALMSGFKTKERRTHCVTKQNITASNIELAVFLNIKLAAIRSEYRLVSEFPTCTPKTLKPMNTEITAARNIKMRSRVFSASPTSRMERDRNRRSL